jgi:phosphoglycolate phosphatase
MAHLLLHGRPMAPIDAVLFDKDGTMSHSEPLLVKLARARLLHCLKEASSAGLAAEAVDALRDLLRRSYGLHADGVDPAGITAVASRDHNLIATATSLVQVGLGWPEALSLSSSVFDACDALPGQESPAHPLPTAGLSGLLESLSAADVRCAVISNDHLRGIHGFLGQHGLSHHFQAIWSAEHRPCKPDPAAVHGVCASLGIPPERCALIGDANSDLRMARQAGVAVVLGYRAGWSQPPPLDPEVPQISHWHELQVEPA